MLTPIRTAVLTVLRSISQIFLLCSAPSGVLILLALGIVDWRIAGLVLIGATVECLGVMSMDPEHDSPINEIRTGLHGYNGALIGAASAIFAGISPLAIMLTILCTLAAIVIHGIMRTVFSTSLAKANLPVATGPFCVVIALTWAFLADQLEPPTPLIIPDFDAGPLNYLLESFAQVLLVSGPVSGALILSAIYVGSWRAGVFATFGAALAMPLAIFPTGEYVALAVGLYGYCAILVSIAIGATLWNERPLRWRISGATIGILLTVALQYAMTFLPVPTLTWPFLIAMWAVLIFGRWLDIYNHRRILIIEDDRTPAQEPLMVASSR